ncbi:hypothetical protein BD560DRAFT_405420 [Blakeslea trispora]|nr:hypothetical protein BD560DRAFT_405420 [Blakeslea trispora]
MIKANHNNNKARFLSLIDKYDKEEFFPEVEDVITVTVYLYKCSYNLYFNKGQSQIHSQGIAFSLFYVYLI